MLTKQKIMRNKHGLEFTVQMSFVEKMGKYCLNMENTAKMILYSDAKIILPITEEKEQIKALVAMGFENMKKLLEQKGGTQC